MALSPLNWKYVGSASFPSSLPNAHDTLYLLGTSIKYADGSTRTPGSGSAWTWTREQSTGVTVALQGAPPVNALSMRYLIANQVAAGPTYALVNPDTTRAGNAVLIGMNRASGAYTTWSAAQPFGGGFSGYWRATRAFSAVIYTSVSMWESQEGCVIQWADNAGATAYAVLGAIADPLSNVSGTTCESDGRLYFMGGSGGGTNTTASWLNSAADGSMFTGVVTDGTMHLGCFAPGSTSLIGTSNQILRFGNFNPAQNFVNRANRLAQMPVSLAANTATGVGNFIGQLRQIYIFRSAQSRTTLRDNTGALIGHVLGSSINSWQQAVLLTDG